MAKYLYKQKSNGMLAFLLLVLGLGMLYAVAAITGGNWGLEPVLQEMWRWLEALGAWAWQSIIMPVVNWLVSKIVGGGG